MNPALAHIPELAGPRSLVRFDEPMARHTTLRVGGPADCYVEPDSEQALGKLVRFCSDTQTPLFVVGRGSNLLVRDGGIRGVVISLTMAEFTAIAVDGAQMRCGAGARLKQV